MYKFFLAAFAALAALLSGCMFDVVSVRETPTVFTPATEPSESFTIQQAYTVPIGTGFPTRIKANTRWVMIGQIPQGKVFTSKDQILSVEASNIHEAALVMEGKQLTGFYLLVEKTFCPAKNPIEIE